MNKHRMLELADFLENIEPHRFNISRWAANISKNPYREKFDYEQSSIIDINVCNTAGCIAGWAVAYYNNGFAEFPKELNLTTAAYNVIRGAELLDLTYEEATRLFYYSEQESVWWKYIEEIPGTEDIISDMSDNGDCIDSYDLDEYITNKVACKFLRKIANGEMTL